MRHQGVLRLHLHLHYTLHDYFWIQSRAVLPQPGLAICDCTGCRVNYYFTPCTESRVGHGMGRPAWPLLFHLFAAFCTEIINANTVLYGV